MQLNTPESFDLKNKEARKKVGSHFLIAIAGKNATLLARLRNARTERPAFEDPEHQQMPQWVTIYQNEEANHHPLIACAASIGDMGDMREFHSHIHSALDWLANDITKRYVSIHAAERLARNIMKYQYDNKPFAYGLNTILLSPQRRNQFALINFNGQIKWFSHFVVAGCLNENTERKDARRKAIEFLTKKCGDGQPARWRKNPHERLEELMVETFERFDVPERNAVLDLFWIHSGGGTIITRELNT